MRLDDFQRTIKYFNFDKGALSVVYMPNNVKRYELKFGGVKFSFVADGKDNNVIVSGDMPDFNYLPSNNIFGIDKRENGIVHIQTREGLLLALISASHNKEKESGSYSEINAKIIGEILAEVTPFISYDGLLKIAGNGINYNDQDLRDSLEAFAKAVNPFEGKTADMIDATNLPLNIGISGGSHKDKDEKVIGTWLDITDLKSKNSTRYTCSKDGFSYRVNYITPDKSKRKEIIYNYSSKSRSEKVVIREWIGKKIEKVVIRRGNKQNISDYFGNEVKWEYLLDSELNYDVTNNSVKNLPKKSKTDKSETDENSYSSASLNDLQGIYEALNQASTLANEITSPVLPKTTRGRY